MFRLFFDLGSSLWGLGGLAPVERGHGALGAVSVSYLATSCVGAGYWASNPVE